MSDVHEGGCVCGSVRYRTIGAPMLATVCHCTFCQKRTGSAFSEPVIFRMEQVEFSGGALTMYEHLSLSRRRASSCLLSSGKGRGGRGKFQVRNLKIGPDTFFLPGRFPKPVAMA